MVLNEINDLIKERQTIIKDSKFDLEFVLLMEGMKGATSIYACL